ncbi:hypothetical protein GCM10027589_34880 [Actinocorallia lasiicapitis]
MRRVAGGAGIVVVGGGLAGLLVASGLDQADKFASVIGGFAALSALAVALRGNGAAVPAPAARVVRELPATSVHFRDREAVLKELGRAWRRARSANTALVVVCTGRGGIGKSQLALKWARGLGVPGHQLYADLSDGGERSIEDVLGEFLRSLGVEAARMPAEAGEMRRLFLEKTGERPVVVFLDNLTRGAQLRRLVPTSAGSVVVATARTMPELVDAVEVAVPPLPDEHVRRLLLDLLGGGAGEVPKAELDRAAARVAGIPLVARAVADELRRGGPAEPAEGDDPVDHAFDAAYTRLTPEAAALYRSLGVLFGTHFSAEMAAATSGLGEPPVAELVEAGLVEDGPEFTISTDAREHAAERLAGPERAAALARLIERP